MKFFHPRYKKHVLEFTLYILIALGGVAVDMASFFVALHFFSVLFSQWIGALLGALHNQLWHHYYLFDHDKTFSQTLTPVLILTVVSILLSGPLLLFLQNIFGSLWWSKVILIALMAVINFFLRKFWIFSSKKDHTQTESPDKTL